MCGVQNALLCCCCCCNCNDRGFYIHALLLLCCNCNDRGFNIHALLLLCCCRYNSLGAYATVNHLHFQAYHLSTPFACERAATSPWDAKSHTRSRKARISRLVDYPVNGFVIETGDSSLEDMVAVVAEACQRLQQRNIPHNLLIADCGARVFLWPQNFAQKQVRLGTSPHLLYSRILLPPLPLLSTSHTVTYTNSLPTVPTFCWLAINNTCPSCSLQARGELPEALLDTGVNPAVFEISGHMLLKREEDYAEMDQDLAVELLSLASLDEKEFLEVGGLCFGERGSRQSRQGGRGRPRHRDAIDTAGEEAAAVVAVC